MKKITSIIIFFIFLFSITTFSQEKPKAELIDEFGSISCGDFLSRFDNLLISLQKDPNSTGYIYIFGDQNEPKNNLFYELIVQGEVFFHKFDSSRIKVIRAKGEGNLRTQMWIIPEGANLPEIEQENYISKIADASKPFIVLYDGDDGYCPIIGQNGLFIEILESNPKNRGHLVIYEKSRVKYEKAKKELKQSLNKISQKSLKFFYVKSEIRLTEYWIVPKKKLN